MLGRAGHLTALITRECIGAIAIGCNQAMSTAYGVECGDADARRALHPLRCRRRSGYIHHYKQLVVEDARSSYKPPSLSRWL